jgi:hypothetical protein
MWLARGSVSFGQVLETFMYQVSVRAVFNLSDRDVYLVGFVDLVEKWIKIHPDSQTILWNKQNPGQ